MGRKKGQADTTEPETPPAAVAPAAAPPTVSKAEAVRRAVAEGIDSPDEGVAFVKAKFGIDMGKPMWSSYRSQDKARKNKAAGQPPAKPKAAQPATHNGSPAELIRQLKGLIATFGAETVKDVTEALAE